MYLIAHRVRRIKGEKVEVGINAFLHQHEERELPEDMQDNRNIIDQIVYENPGKLIAESVDLVPRNNAVLSFVDIVGKEDLDQEYIQDFLEQKEHDIKQHFQEKYVPFTYSDRDIAVQFGVSYGLRGQEVREYKALTERAMRLLESPEPPRWRSEDPWIVIHCSISDNQETFRLSTETAEKLKQMYDESWIPARISVDLHYGTKRAFKSVHGDLIQHIAPVLTDLTLEQIAAQGGLILYNPDTQKKIKWPELREI